VVTSIGITVNIDVKRREYVSQIVLLMWKLSMDSGDEDKWKLFEGESVVEIVKWSCAHLRLPQIEH
jgi:hypothetical protein